MVGVEELLAPERGLQHGVGVPELGARLLGVELDGVGLYEALGGMQGELHRGHDVGLEEEGLGIEEGYGDLLGTI